MMEILCIFGPAWVSSTVPISHLLKILDKDGSEAQCNKHQYIMTIIKRVQSAALGCKSQLDPFLAMSIQPIFTLNIHIPGWFTEESHSSARKAIYWYVSHDSFDTITILCCHIINQEPLHLIMIRGDFRVCKGWMFFYIYLYIYMLDNNIC